MVLSSLFQIYIFIIISQNKPLRHSAQISMVSATVTCTKIPNKIELVFKLKKPNTMPAIIAPVVSLMGFPKCIMQYGITAINIE